MVINLPFVISITSSILIILLGFIVFRNDRKSVSNLVFFIYTILAGIWGILNYFIFTVPTPQAFLLSVRILLFIATWVNLFIYLFTLVYPYRIYNFKQSYVIGIVFVCLIVSLMSLTPFTFREVSIFSNVDRNIIIGPGIIFFGILASLLNLCGFFNLFLKLKKSKKEEKGSYILLIIGLFLTSFLIVLFNYVMPNVLHVKKFISYGALFMFPFIFLTSYAVSRYRFLNTRIALSVIFITLLLLLFAIEISQKFDISQILISLLTLGGVFILSILLINSVYREIEQREELERLNKKLDELNKIKSEFLSFASHQVKAPMAVVKGYAELIESAIENVPPEARDFAKKIKDAVNKLLVLIEEFMDYRRIEEGRMEFNFERLDLVSLIKEIFENMKLLSQEKNLEFTLETNIDSLICNLDKVRFSQVIQNLIDNAIKYTNKGFVKVSIEKKDDKVLITVSDSGIGMSKELQEKLFGQFVRDPSIKKEIHGTGLGLYIAKYIVESHKGRIWTESEGEGKGSRFYVELPILNL